MYKCSGAQDEVVCLFQLSDHTNLSKVGFGMLSLLQNYDWSYNIV
jgi:hypothetical protein